MFRDPGHDHLEPLCMIQDDVYRVYNHKRWTFSVVRRVSGDYEKEMVISERLREIDGFERIEDYWKISRKEKEEEGNFIETTHYYESLRKCLSTEKSILLYENYCLLFEIVYSLNRAFLSVGLNHGKINLDTILCIRTIEPRKYILNNQIIQIQSGWKPILRNYEKSSLDNQCSGISFRDLSQLSKLATHLFSHRDSTMRREWNFDGLVGEKNYDRLLFSIYQCILYIKQF